MKFQKRKNYSYMIPERESCVKQKMHIYPEKLGIFVYICMNCVYFGQKEAKSAA